PCLAGVLVLSSLLFLYELPHAEQLCIICGQLITPIMSRLWFVAPRRSGFFGRHIALGLRRRDAHQQSRSFKRAWTRNYHLSTSNYLTSAHVDGRRLNPMIN